MSEFRYGRGVDRHVLAPVLGTHPRGSPASRVRDGLGLGRVGPATPSRPSNVLYVPDRPCPCATPFVPSPGPGSRGETSSQEDSPTTQTSGPDPHCGDGDARTWSKTGGQPCLCPANGTTSVTEIHFPVRDVDAICPSTLPVGDEAGDALVVGTLVVTSGNPRPRGNLWRGVRKDPSL